MIALPPYIDADAWAGFEEMRTMIRKPLTDRARKLILVKLDALRKAGHCPNQSLDQSTENDWKSVYAPREMEIPHKPSTEAERTQQYLASQRPDETTPARRAEIAQMLQQAKAGLRRVA